MKKVFFMLIALIALTVMTSCEKEEVVPQLWEWNYDGPLLGEWNVVSSVDDVTFDPYTVDEGSILSFTDVDKWRAKGHTFAGTLTYDEIIYPFEWYLKGNSLMIIFNDEGDDRANTRYDAVFQYINTTFVSDNEMNLGKVQLVRRQ